MMKNCAGGGILVKKERECGIRTHPSRPSIRSKLICLGTYTIADRDHIRRKLLIFNCLI